MAAFCAYTNHLSVNIFGVVWVDVTGTTAAVRNLGSCHAGFGFASGLRDRGQ
jgi:hypothetical protein